MDSRRTRRITCFLCSVGGSCSTENTADSVVPISESTTNNRLHETSRGVGSDGKRGIERTYATWYDMIRRCANNTDRRFKSYGGRGISVDSSWLSFRSFVADMGIRPLGMTLERIDNNGNYEPGNCKWATRLEQQQNTRQTRLLTFDGETLSLSAWARRFAMAPSDLRKQLHRTSIEVIAKRRLAVAQ